jgi:hypothetical protein
VARREAVQTRQSHMMLVVFCSLHFVWNLFVTRHLFDFMLERFRHFELQRLNDYVRYVYRTGTVSVKSASVQVLSPLPSVREVSLVLCSTSESYFIRCRRQYDRRYVHCTDRQESVSRHIAQDDPGLTANSQRAGRLIILTMADKTENVCQKEGNGV